MPAGLRLFEAKAPQPTSEVHEDALTCPARIMVPAKQRVHCAAFLAALVGDVALGRVQHSVSNLGLKLGCWSVAT